MKSSAPEKGPAEIEESLDFSQLDIAPTVGDYEALKRENEYLRKEIERLRDNGKRKHKVVKTTLRSKMSHHVVSHMGKISRRHMRGTASSMASAEILAGLFTPRETVPEKLLSKLDDPASHVAYFRGKQFALELMKLCEDAQSIFEKESRCIYIQSPCHVFGDIHGNLDDLHFFGETVWSNGISLTPGRLLFLGDYVDRGMYSLECVAYLLSLKVMSPQKVFLLRGNHELRDVNSWEDYYGEGSFLWQCKSRFGVERGAYLWEVVNQMFDRLPLAAVIDNDIFCIHGGIPRPRAGFGQIESIQRVPHVAAVSPPYPCEDPDLTRVAYECLWSDPAKPSDEALMDSKGYGANPRGSTAQCFGRAAVEDFLEHYDMSYIFRAHEKTSEGITVSKGGRVLTVFSTSKDHHLGEGAMSACLLVDDGHIEVITKDPAYVSRMERQKQKWGFGSSHNMATTPGKDTLFSFPEHAVEFNPSIVKEVPVYYDAEENHDGESDMNVDMSDEESEGNQHGEGCYNEMEYTNGNGRHVSIIEGSVVPDSDEHHGQHHRPTMLTLEQEAEIASGAVPPLESPNSLFRRDSLDLGVFRQLRAQAPQVILQPSTEQRIEFRACDVPLRDTRLGSVSDHSSQSGSSEEGEKKDRKESLHGTQIPIESGN